MTTKMTTFPKVRAFIEAHCFANKQAAKETIDCLDYFERWLRSEIDYLESIKRTEHGDGSLSKAKSALREAEYVRN